MGTQLPLPQWGTAPPIFGAYLLRPNGCMDQDVTCYGCRPHPRGLCVRWRPSPPPQKGDGTTKFSAHVYCGQTSGWIKMPLCTKVGLSPGGSVLDGDPAPSSQRGWSPLHNFRFISIVPKRLDASRFRMPLGMEVGLIPGDIVLDEDPAPSQKGGGARGRSPQFSAHVYCGQTAGWIKMALGMEVGLGSVHIVLDGNTAPLPKTGPPIFGPSLLWPNGWMHQLPLGMEVGLSPGDFVLYGDPAPYPKRGGAPTNFRPTSPNSCIDQDATWYGGRPRPTRHCVPSRPSCPQKKGTPTPPSFWPMSIVATVAHLSYC